MLEAQTWELAVEVRSRWQKRELFQEIKSIGFGHCLEIRVDWEQKGIGEGSRIARSSWLVHHSLRRHPCRGQGLRETDHEFSSVHVEFECLSHVCFSCRKPSPNILSFANYSNSRRLNNISNFICFSLILSVVPFDTSCYTLWFSDCCVHILN